MPENGTATAAADGSVRFPPVPCESPPCGSAGSAGSSTTSCTHEPTQLDNAEAAVIQQAKVDGDRALIAARAELARACEAVLVRWSAAHAALDAVADLRAAWPAYLRPGDGEAASGGPAGQERGRPRWIALMLWPTVIAAGTYDTWYFSKIFRQIADIGDSPVSVGYYVSLLPGVLLALAIMLSGHWIAEPIHARAARAARAARRGRNEPPDGAPRPPWIVPSLFLLFVVSTLAIWAVIRADQARDRPGGEGFKPLPVALLLVLFTVTAVAIKVVHHNPAADRTAALRRAMTHGRRQRQVAMTAMTRHRKAWYDLETTITEAAVTARLCLDEAFVTLLRDRATHRRAGPLAPPYRQPPSGPDETFVGLSEPSLRLDVLDHAKAVLDTHPPRELAARWEALNDPWWWGGRGSNPRPEDYEY